DSKAAAASVPDFAVVAGGPARAGGDSPNSSLTPSSSSSSLSSDSGSSSVVSSNSPIVGNQPSVNVENDASSGSSSDVDDDVDGAAGASTTATTMIDPSADSVGISRAPTIRRFSPTKATPDWTRISTSTSSASAMTLLTSTAEVPEAEASFLADFLTRPPLPTICGLGAVIQRLRRHGPPASPFQENPGAAEDLQDPMPPVIEDVCRIGSPDSEALLQLLLSPHLAALWDCLLRVAHPPADETSIDLDDFLEIEISTAVGDAPDAANDPATAAAAAPPEAAAAACRFSAERHRRGGGAHARHRRRSTAPELFSRDVTLLKAADQPLGFTAVRRCICPTSPKPAVAVAAASGDDGTASSSSLSASPRQAIAVARVLAGSQADVAGGLHVGDIIREANGQPMETPEALQRLLRQTVGRITLRIESETPPESPLSPPPPPMPEPRLLRACFDYQPERDPCCPAPSWACASGMATSWRLSTRATRPSGRPVRLVVRENRRASYRRRRSRSEGRPFSRRAGSCPGPPTGKPVMYRAQSAADFDRAELAL
uniref:PDZ domain-containing protein n=1 Tax=Macrostomum lignano TaxID=282301 RepID=A0A1I8FFK5_9PLAT